MRVYSESNAHEKESTNFLRPGSPGVRSLWDTCTVDHPIAIPTLHVPYSQRSTQIYSTHSHTVCYVIGTHTVVCASHPTSDTGS